MSNVRLGVPSCWDGDNRRDFKISGAFTTSLPSSYCRICKRGNNHYVRRELPWWKVSVILFCTPTSREFDSLYVAICSIFLSARSQINVLCLLFLNSSAGTVPEQQKCGMNLAVTRANSLALARL